MRHSFSESSAITVIPESNYLSTYYIHLAVCGMQEAVGQLSLIHTQYETHSLNAMVHFETLPAPMETRFSPSNWHNDGLFFRLTGEPYAKAMCRLLFDQLRSDKNYIAHMLRSTHNDLLCDAGNFRYLEAMLAQNNELEMETHFFILDYVRNLLTLHDFVKRKEKLEKASAGRTLTPQFDHCHMWNAMRLRFTRNWENARQAQQMAECNQFEKMHRDNINKSRQKIDYETRCKMETETFLLLQIDTMNQNSVKWMDRYEADYEAVEVDIQVTIDLLADLRRKRDDFYALFEHRKFVIEDFYMKKQQREEFERNLVKYTKNALILQCWWRAVMVRNGYGAFKRKKGKKGKGKGKK